MDDTVDSLRKQLEPISRRIHALKNIFENTEDDYAKQDLLKELTQLRWQALFYLEKIENLKRQGNSDHD